VAVVLDEITKALKELGVLATSETPTADDATDAFNALNTLLDAWAAERLIIYTTTRTTFTITSGTQNYNIVGLGGGPRPVYIDHVNFVDTSQTPNLERQMQPLTEDAWSIVPLKGLTAPFPTSWYYNPTFPTGTLSLWPVPTSSSLQGALYAPQPVGAFVTLQDAISLPPGYERMIVKNLAVELAPSYERVVDPLLMMQAADSKADVKRSNRRLMDLSLDAAALLQGRNRLFQYNIFAGP
jgi:hypothetical protein